MNRMRVESLLLLIKDIMDRKYVIVINNGKKRILIDTLIFQEIIIYVILPSLFIFYFTFVCPWCHNINCRDQDIRFIIDIKWDFFKVFKVNLTKYIHIL